MCSPFDARPPELPAALRLPPLAGGAPAETIELTSADGTAFSAAVALPTETRDEDEAPPTGVVILPDVRGLYPFYSELAERFALAGHPAIVIDYFGRTAGLGPRGEDFDFWPHVEQTTVEQVQADVAAAEQELKQRAGVERLVTVGFCFGGLHSLLVGTSDELQSEAVVAFYGGLDGTRFGIEGPLQRAEAIHKPVLGLYGDADQGIPVEQLEEFDARLTGPREIVIYPGAPHSFFDRSFAEHQQTCEDAWFRVLAFVDGAGATVVPDS
ncbi:MAG: dienelactone hydrolase family protein [Solirubrobacterales bacterium]|nr:dienelactone hydrolase family protein [Solirubrobacterales bacterium]